MAEPLGMDRMYSITSGYYDREYLNAWISAKVRGCVRYVSGNRPAGMPPMVNDEGNSFWRWDGYEG